MASQKLTVIPFLTMHDEIIKNFLASRVTSLLLKEPSGCVSMEPLGDCIACIMSDAPIVGHDGYRTYAETSEGGHYFEF